MTRVLVDMTFRKPRDHFFAQKDILHDLGEYVEKCVHSVLGPVEWVVSTNRKDLVEASSWAAKASVVEPETQLSPDSPFSCVELCAGSLSRLDSHLNGHVLYLNPLQGPLCQSRLRDTIGLGRKGQVVASVISLSVNEHPLWVEQVPARFASKESFILNRKRNGSSLRNDKAMVCAFQGSNGREISGSQHLSDVFKFDAACVYIPESVARRGFQFQEFAWCLWNRARVAEAPWFYAVPIWSMSRDSRVDIAQSSIR